jgi:hypothetical protein
VAKDFDATLSDAIDLAAGAAQGPGAAAARIRGRKRTTRKRVALATMSFVLLAAGSTAAFKFSSSHGAAPQLPAGTFGSTPGTAVSTTPTTAASSAPAAVSKSTGTSTDIATGTPTGAPATSTSGAPTTSASSPVSATAPSTTWLTPKQVPFHDLMNWSAGTPEHCTGSSGFNADYPGFCVPDMQPGTHAAKKSDVVLFNSVGVPTGNGAWAQPIADQDFYTYANAADAQADFQSITHELLAEDALSRGAIDPRNNRLIVRTTTVTAQSTDSMAVDRTLRDDNGAPGEVNGEESEASDVHLYFAIKDKVLEVLEVRGGVSISDTSNDKAILATVVSALS